MTDQAYEILRDEILARRFAPGERLTVRPLSEATGLSPTPIKSALTTLAREGLVRLEPYRGFFVSVIDAEDLSEIYELRQVLDGIAARRAASMSEPDRDELVRELRSLLAEQRACSGETDHHRYSELDISFHAAIVEASGKPRLIQLSSQLLAQLQLGRIVSTSVPGQIDRSLEEHGAIIDAVEQGDGSKAERLVRRHVAGASDVLQKHLAAHHET